MNPMAQFCHNLDCPARGQVGQGNITIHSQKERRYRCSTCGKTFAATTGTPFYRLRLAVDLVTIVLTLLTHGCPTQATQAAFGLDERTVASWLRRAGQHSQQLHQHLVQQGQIDLQHVQADELWVKVVGSKVWQAMAMAVPSRLWLGGAISVHRDRHLITALVEQVRGCALTTAILVCVDDLSSYVSAFRKVFRRRVPTGKVRQTSSGSGGGIADWTAHQALRQAPPQRCEAADCSGQPGRHHGGAGGDWHWDGYQHLLH